MYNKKKRTTIIMVKILGALYKIESTRWSGAWDLCIPDLYHLSKSHVY